jgi:hypothetical protein
MKFKKVKISKIFEFPTIKGVTKKFIKNNEGKIPVYGGKIKEEPIGFIKDNLSGVKYFENCLAWNREGSVGFVFWHKHKFTTNDHHRPLILKKEFKKKLNLTYLKYIIQSFLMKQGFEWSKTAGKNKVSSFDIEIPIKENEEFDLEIQQNIANRYKKIEQIKNKLKEDYGKIRDLKVEINYNSFKEIELYKILKYEQPQKYIVETTKYNENYKTPVLTAGKTFVLGYTDEKNNIFPKNKLPVIIFDDFTTTTKIVDFQFKVKSSAMKILHFTDLENIDKNFIFYTMKKIKIDNSKHKRYWISEYSKLRIKIPIKEDGDFDLEIQQNIVKKYKKIEEIKQKLKKDYEKIKDLEVEIK